MVRRGEWIIWMKWWRTSTIRNCRACASCPHQILGRTAIFIEGESSKCKFCVSISSKSPPNRNSIDYNSNSNTYNLRHRCQDYTRVPNSQSFNYPYQEHQCCSGYSHHPNANGRHRMHSNACQILWEILCSEILWSYFHRMQKSLGNRNITYIHLLGFQYF